MAKTSASVRVAQSIRDDITAGRLKVGDRLPTRLELCEQYGIAAMTAAKVVRTLVDEGVAVSDTGRGVFVAAIPGTVQARPVGDGDPLKQLEERVRVIEEQLAELTRQQ